MNTLTKPLFGGRSVTPTTAARETAPSQAAAPDLRRITEICERAAAGDLEARITGVDLDTDFGRLCNAINHMLDIADSYVRETSSAMESCSNDRFHRPILLRGLRGSYRHSAAIINQAGLKMQGTNQRLAATAKLASETATNLSTVAAACEELNSSSAEISRQAGESATQTQSAVNQASLARSSVQSLNEATKKVENIVTLIHKIAGQTNLLALNATIEAARAGAQGRGFAVVANEVKELARSSAKATEQISQQIGAMQGKVVETVKFIEGVNASIQIINQGAANVAGAVREQLQATDDISQNIAEVSRKTSEISENMNISQRPAA